VAQAVECLPSKQEMWLENWKRQNHQQECQHSNTLYFQFLVLISAVLLKLRPNAPLLANIYNTLFNLMKRIDFHLTFQKYQYNALTGMKNT
jgi:hypothetical protein